MSNKHVYMQLFCQVCKHNPEPKFCKQEPYSWILGEYIVVTIKHSSIALSSCRIQYTLLEWEDLAIVNRYMKIDHWQENVILQDGVQRSPEIFFSLSFYESMIFFSVHS